MLQAESEKLRQAWIQAVQASIASAYKDITDNYYIEVRRRADTRLATDAAVLFLTRLPVPAASGPNGLALHQQHRLGQRAPRSGGEERQGGPGGRGEPAPKGAEPPGQ